MADPSFRRTRSESFGLHPGQPELAPGHRISRGREDGLDWDTAGNLYVSSYTQRHVWKFDASGKDLGLFVSTNLTGPTNLWFGENGDLFISDFDGAAVRRFDSTGHSLGNFIQGITQVEGIAYLPDGDILLGSGGAHSVKRFDRGGASRGDFIPPRTANLITPNAVVLRALPDPVPAAPGGLTATSTANTSVVLHWQDHSDSGFRVYRETDGGAATAIAEVAPNITSYVDETVQEGHVYSYSVSAFSAGGESAHSSSAITSTGCAACSRRRSVRS